MLKLEKTFIFFNLLFLLSAVIGEVLCFHAVPKIFPLLYALAFIGAIILGIKSNFNFPRYGWIILSILVGIKIGLEWIAFIAFGAICLLLFSKKKIQEKDKMLFTLSVLIAIILPLIPAFYGIVPILEPQKRFEPLAISYVLSGYSLALAISIYPSLTLLVLGIIISAISTFRIVALLVLLAYVYSTYPKLNKKALVIGGIGVIVAFLLRGMAEPSYNFIQGALCRPAFTYLVYERIFHITMPWGKLLILPTLIPGYKVASFFGTNVRYTYTIYGQPAFDFGVLGLLEGLILGVAIREARGVKWAHAFLLSILTVFIEIGLDVPKLTTIFLLAFISKAFVMKNER
ncbi:hypothetical protein PFDSM3638_00150 [Pyrococcus furiosus DSM 3638]|uniref:Oligosaccharide repeat unit polymerase n=3 Tax=Pyrococcus furiosus TaxID=2261 RepID=A0A5C0XST2_PYRFU|nr:MULTISPECIES: hypothetical protein [Pyrococcus]AAL80169.1 hypothetical protein PF0045 [Pyrococcus furiosus DSM 3638]AFN04528.1 hypothetical protein PFC_07980 [Pyrococcus furiosus COM1]MDK2869188.1 hypothetical protein [Pyrococcus sp.]QEK77780.1 hypothetical protein PFDSM3638_00150 [Pyrococcus furiosus DSM 3638]